MSNTPPPSRFTVGVMGSGSDEHATLAHPLGQLLAQLEVNLLTGAGGGTMTSVSQAFTSSKRSVGICIGIVPCARGDRRTAKNGYPNPFVELAIRTHLPHSGASGKDELSRNHINILSSAAIVVLPGGSGTRTEAELALDYGKPVIAFTSEGGAVDLPDSIRRVTRLKDVEAFLRKLIESRAS